MDNTERLAEQIIAALTAAGHRLGVVESCTGGRLAATITSVPGASAAFTGGVVAYANQVKVDVLGVDELTLEAFGAVSAECACELACNGEKILGTEYTVAITGTAGPAGGTADKPVGTVFIAWSSPAGVEVEQQSFSGTRPEIQRQACERALTKLAALLGLPE